MKRFFSVAIIAFAQVFATGYAQPFPWNQTDKKSPFTDVAQKNIPAVVLIKTQIEDKRNETSEFFGPRPDPFFEEFLRRFFGSHKMNNSSSPLQSAGSGFFVRSDGWIITNNHVIKNAKKVVVVTHDGKTLDAEVIGTDPQTDLAVLKIEIENAPYIEFGNSDDLVVAEWVMAIGHPFKLKHTVTVGVVSATASDREDYPHEINEGGVIQTDAAINSGNSGGPLLNMDGKLVGVNVAIVTPGRGFAGVGFSIPSKIAKRVFHSIMENGRVDRAYLGIVLQNIDSELAEATHLDEKGILIAEVMKDSPAKRAGLQNGDIIIEMNGSAVKSMNAFRNKIALMNPDTSVSLKIRRKSETFFVDVTLGIFSEIAAATAKIFQKLGLKVEDLSNISEDVLDRYGYNPKTAGVFITHVERASPANYAGIASHQLITGVVTDWNNPREVRTLEDLREALKVVENRTHVVLIIRHKNMQRYCTLKMP